MHKILWDFEIWTDPPVTSWRSDFQLINMKKRTFGFSFSCGQQNETKSKQNDWQTPETSERTKKKKRKKQNPNKKKQKQNKTKNQTKKPNQNKNQTKTKTKQKKNKTKKTNYRTWKWRWHYLQWGLLEGSALSQTKRLEELKIWGRIETNQITAMLRSAIILRSVLETCCHLNFPEKTRQLTRMWKIRLVPVIVESLGIIKKETNEFIPGRPSQCEMQKNCTLRNCVSN